MTVYTLSYQAPPIDRGEILRYAGVGESNPETEALLDRCLGEISSLTYKVCYCELPVAELDIASDTLEKALSGCDSAILFGATVGIEMDRLIARYSALSPATALMMQAVGAERVESLCNTFCKEIAKGRAAKPRVSPGYGDIPLDTQKYIFALLDCPRKIGLSLTDSLMMTPTKSVTAIFGVKNENT